MTQTTAYLSRTPLGHGLLIHYRDIRTAVWECVQAGAEHVSLKSFLGRQECSEG